MVQLNWYRHGASVTLAVLCARNVEAMSYKYYILLQARGLRNSQIRIILLVIPYDSPLHPRLRSLNGGALLINPLDQLSLDPQVLGAAQAPRNSTFTFGDHYPPQCLHEKTGHNIHAPRVRDQSEHIANIKEPTEFIKEQRGLFNAIAHVVEREKLPKKRLEQVSLLI